MNVFPVMRRNAAFCLLCALCVVSILVLLQAGPEARREGGESFYAITFKHHGVNPREMERTITIPLEDALYALDGIKQVISTTEHSSSRVVVRFAETNQVSYAAVRDVVQHVYEALPSSVQRPELVSSSDSRQPVWSAAVFYKSGESNKNGNTRSLGDLLESTVKPLLERVETAGEVELYGCAGTEVRVSLNAEAAAARGVDAAHVAAFLSGMDGVQAGGFIQEGCCKTLISLDGRIQKTADLEKLWLPAGEGRSIQLSDIAVITEAEQEPEVLSRLNGYPAAVLAVMGSSDADPAILSARIAQTLDGISDLPLEFLVLHDRGAEEAEAMRAVLAAAIQGAVAVALSAVLLTLLLTGRATFPNRPTATPLIAGALSVPCIALFSVSCLRLAGFNTDRMILAGLASGLGAAVDAAIISIGRLKGAKSQKDAGSRLKDLIPSLFAGTFTTVIVLVPFAFIPDVEASVYSAALAIGCCSLVSFISALVLLPPFLVVKTKGAVREKAGPGYCCLPRLYPVFRPVRRLFLRLLARHSLFCVYRAFVYPVCAFFITVIAAFLLLDFSHDSGAAASADTVHARVEFPGALSSKSVDILMAEYARSLCSRNPDLSVQCSARSGSATILLSFDSEDMDVSEARELMQSLPLSGGYLHFIEDLENERSWTVSIFGEDDKECRRLAEELLRICMKNTPLRDAVLHFKDGREQLSLKPDKGRTASLGLGFIEYADAIRRAVHGPPAYKRITKNGETDVRVGTWIHKPAQLSFLSSLPLSSGETRIQLSSFMEFEKVQALSSIHREDRRRTASFSVRSDVIHPAIVREWVMDAAEKLRFPEGYSLEFDRAAMERLEALTLVPYIFLAAVLLCYMAIAAITESFCMPLAVLSVVLPSLSLPLVVLYVSKAALSLTLACAFVAAAGITVNASVLTVDVLAGNMKSTPGLSAQRLYASLRKRLPILTATSISTALGALPFMGLGGSVNVLVRSLSFVTFFGVIASFFCSVSLVPSLAVLFPTLFKQYSGSACAESKKSQGNGS